MPGYRIDVLRAATHKYLTKHQAFLLGGLDPCADGHWLTLSDRFANLAWRALPPDRCGWWCVTASLVLGADLVMRP